MQLPIPSPMLPALLVIFFSLFIYVPFFLAGYYIKYYAFAYIFSINSSILQIRERPSGNARMAERDVQNA